MARRMSVVIRGTLYADAWEAAEALGVSRVTIYRLNNMGRIDSAGVGRGKHTNHYKPKARPVRIGPIEYPSMRDAAKDLGVTLGTVKRYMASISAQSDQSRAALGHRAGGTSAPA